MHRKMMRNTRAMIHVLNEFHKKPNPACRFVLPPSRTKCCKFINPTEAQWHFTHNAAWKVLNRYLCDASRQGDECHISYGPWRKRKEHDILVKRTFNTERGIREEIIHSDGKSHMSARREKTPCINKTAGCKNQAAPGYICRLCNFPICRTCRTANNTCMKCGLEDFTEEIPEIGNGQEFPRCDFHKSQSKHKYPMKAILTPRSDLHCGICDIRENLMTCNQCDTKAVSYTHLTLPTIYSV